MTSTSPVFEMPMAVILEGREMEDIGEIGFSAGAPVGRISFRPVISVGRGGR